MSGLVVRPVQEKGEGESEMSASQPGGQAASGKDVKQAKPTLGGTKFKTRKRDEKVKLDVAAFSEQLVGGLSAGGGNLEEVRKFLDGAGSQLDYR